MAFSNALTGRMEELRYGNIRSPGVEAAPYTNAVNSTRDSNPYFPNTHQSTSNDSRATLQRRFTTDSSKLTMARPFGQQHSGMNTNVRKDQQQLMYEEIQNAKRKTEETLRMLEEQEANLKRGVPGSDLETISNRINRISLNGPVSEPTTPPEYADNGLTNRYSRSGRLSMNSIVSPPGLSSRMSQSSTQVTSPSGSRLSGNALFSTSQKPAKSMPASRRGSDEEDDYAEDLPTTRSAAVFNRFSMPVQGARTQQRFSMGAAPGHNSLGPLNTTSFLFDESEDKHLSLNGLDLKSPIAKTIAQLEGEDFPTLTSNGSRLSANSAALDLANKASDVDSWAFGSRLRPAHQSMPQTDSSMYRPVLGNLNSAASDRPADMPRRKSQRHSMGITFEESGEYDTSTMPTTIPVSRPAALQTSYSTNDVPTVKHALHTDGLMNAQKNPVEQQFHNHNVSLGRIPANGVSNRQSREVAIGYGLNNNDEKNSVSSLSGLQASATPFGPGYTPSLDYGSLGMTSPSSGHASPPTYAHSMQTYSLSALTGGPAGNGYQPQGQGMYGANNGYATFGKGQDVATRGAAGRRNNNDEARFNNVPLESYIGGLYELCKDQHGCRYLQRKLEEGNSEHIEAIFAETCPHIIELMTDPFGNYLCQKLFEHCNEEQRTVLINTAAPALTAIALNQHGTRALQKMIEFVHTNEQIEIIVQSLSQRVVELVQDLNGNHVVQKCLTRLGAERCQFIYDAVGNFCVIVGTHRHGCCVLQRCIDHAQGFQKAQLIARITTCAFELVQDPFGNYVVQYILDLDEPMFTAPICMAFQTKVVALSKQKFSSNVIEKCLRTADPAPKRMLIEEMMMGNELEKMLRDSFANYVVQTAMDHADAQTKNRLVEAIRPILPAIKQTPHGRRIASKIMGTTDGPGRLGGMSSGQMAPSDSFTAPFPTGSTGRSGGRRHIQIVGGGFNGPRSNGYAPAENVDNMAPMAPVGYSTAPYGQSNDFNDHSMNGYTPQGYGVNASARFGGFQNGQPGGNYI